MNETVSALVASIVCAAALALLVAPQVFAAAAGQGGLTIIEPDGKTSSDCPLKHTSVKGEVSGFVARVEVTQTFHNPRKEKIEAVYTFPLPADAAVDDMVMRVGERVVRGQIKRREEARQAYEEAKSRGNVASLLDQERPNIFTQSVANIMPGEKVEITIRYVDVLPYEDGAFKFAFPMVVGPRFIPGSPTAKQGTGWAHDTNQVPDASKITPPVTEEGTRAGHDIDLTLTIDAGVPILGIDSKLHDVETAPSAPTKAVVSLKDKKTIPNKDFVLRYTVAGEQIRSGVLVHKKGESGYATIIMIPPKRVKPEAIAPKEMIFVIDCSGSQHGLPLEKAKETMRYAIAHMNPDDTFNIIDFNVTSRMLFSEPKKNSPETREKALKYLQSLEARGGTWMGPAVEAVCKSPAAENRLRIVTFMTDGYVGNDFEIISMVQKLRGRSRWFPFGTGNSINRFLIDQMARAGGGESEIILLNSPGEEIAKRFYERIAAPVLTDISLTCKGVELEEVFPEAVSDLWSRKPLIFKARYSKHGRGSVTVSGHSGGKPYEETIDLVLPEKESNNAALASIWARAKVDKLMAKDWIGIQRGAPAQEIKEQIVKVALNHRIMTQYTSFVAVEETVVTIGGKPTTVTVPVEMPDGVSRERIFGDRAATGNSMAALPAAAGYAMRSAKYKGSAMPGSAPTHAEPLGKIEARAAVTAAEAEQSPAPRKTVRSDQVSADKQVVVARDWTEKLSRDLKELVDMMEKKDAKEDFQHGKIRVTQGKALVQVRLADKSSKTLKSLETAGLKVQFSAAGGNVAIGEIEVKKLRGLAAVAEVLFIGAVEAS